MLTARARSIAIALISGCGLLGCAAALAQSRADAPPPPRLEKLEEGEAPAVTIPNRPPERLIQEEREDGRITSTRVHTGGSTYYVTPNTPVGSALPGDGQSTSNRPAQWRILEFNTRPRKDGERDPAADPARTAAPAPPAPPGPASAPARP